MGQNGPCSISQSSSSLSVWWGNLFFRSSVNLLNFTISRDFEESNQIKKLQLSQNETILTVSEFCSRLTNLRDYGKLSF